MAGRPERGLSRAFGKKISAREHLFVCGFGSAHGERNRAVRLVRLAGTEKAAMWVVVLQSGRKWGSVPIS